MIRSLMTGLIAAGLAGPLGAQSAPQDVCATRDGDILFGTIDWYNPVKGFGFIAPDIAGEKVFLHVSSLARNDINDVTDGQIVAYSMETGANGRPFADLVAVLDAPCPDS